MDELVSNIVSIATSYGGKIILAIIVAVAGIIVVKLLSKGIAKAFTKSKLDERAQKIITKLIKALLLLILLIAIIEILGVPMTSLIALLASCGLAVGLAFQGALANFAGGVMILVFRPFKIGDYVNASDAEGVVSDISIFYTKLLTMDNKQVLVPNGDLMNSNVTNFTAMGKRRVDLDFKITNDIDQELVKSVLIGAATATKGVTEDPPAFARLTAVDDDTYIFTVRAWCKTEEYWDTYFDLIENCSTALAENGIDDPGERLAVRIVDQSKDED